MQIIVQNLNILPRSYCAEARNLFIIYLKI